MAAQACEAKASGLYLHHDLQALQIARRSAYEERNRNRSRQTSRAKPRVGAKGPIRRKLGWAYTQAAYEKSICDRVMPDTREKITALEAELALIRMNSP